MTDKAEQEIRNELKKLMDEFNKSGGIITNDFKLKVQDLKRRMLTLTVFNDRLNTQGGKRDALVSIARGLKNQGRITQDQLNVVIQLSVDEAAKLHTNIEQARRGKFDIRDLTNSIKKLEITTTTIPKEPEKESNIPRDTPEIIGDLQDKIQSGLSKLLGLSKSTIKGELINQTITNTLNDSIEGEGSGKNDSSLLGSIISTVIGAARTAVGFTSGQVVNLVTSVFNRAGLFTETNEQNIRNEIIASVTKNLDPKLTKKEIENEIEIRVKKLQTSIENKKNINENMEELVDNVNEDVNELDQVLQAARTTIEFIAANNLLKLTGNITSYGGWVTVMLEFNANIIEINDIFKDNPNLRILYEQHIFDQLKLPSTPDRSLFIRTFTALLFILKTFETNMVTFVEGNNNYISGASDRVLGLGNVSWSSAITAWRYILEPEDVGEGEWGRTLITDVKKFLNEDSMDNIQPFFRAIMGNILDRRLNETTPNTQKVEQYFFTIKELMKGGDNQAITKKDLVNQVILNIFQKFGSFQAFWEWDGWNEPGSTKFGGLPVIAVAITSGLMYLDIFEDGANVTDGLQTNLGGDWIGNARNWIVISTVGKRVENNIVKGPLLTYFNSVLTQDVSFPLLYFFTAMLVAKYSDVTFKAFSDLSDSGAIFEKRKKKTKKKARKQANRSEIAILSKWNETVESFFKAEEENKQENWKSSFITLGSQVKELKKKELNKHKKKIIEDINKIRRSYGTKFPDAFKDNSKGLEILKAFNNFEES